MSGTGVELIDGIQRNMASARFEIPSDCAKLALRRGDYVKVGVQWSPPAKLGDHLVEAERFWVRIENIAGAHHYTGTVNNTLVYTDEHGLRNGDWIEFESRHILAIEANI